MWNHCPPIQKWSKCDISCRAEPAGGLAMVVGSYAYEFAVRGRHGACGEHVPQLGKMFVKAKIVGAVLYIFHN